MWYSEPGWHAIGLLVFYVLALMILVGIGEFAYLQHKDHHAHGH